MTHHSGWSNTNTKNAQFSLSDAAPFWTPTSTSLVLGFL